ncbi:anthranilate phosphoribosyltransferase [Tulasnella sp. 419]|nr:anthranilate phosphoribosyltransferase [Tulasnella sp. 418]KAG8962719.1 anthranilate phosphoribosyltransferase [Tulasnella sp. 419]
MSSSQETQMTYTPTTFKPILQHLIDHPQSFTHEETTQAFHHLAQPDFSGATPVQVGAFLMALKYSNKAHSPDVISSAAEVMRLYATPLKLENEDDVIVDIVGTGGDGHNAFNVSTTAAIVVAGAGVRVCKHGSKASTSTSGSSDLLSALGCDLTTTTPQGILPRVPFTFLHASQYHPSINRLQPVRSSLPFRTIFNVLGPLLNPASPQYMIVGVYTKELGPAFARALSENKRIRRALVVCGQEGLDEISISGGTYVWDIQRDANGGSDVKELVLHPVHFGLKAHPLDRVITGLSPQGNASILKALLSGEALDIDLPPPVSMEAIRDFVLINTAALLVISGKASNWKEGVTLARTSLESGAAWKAFCTFKNFVSSQ